MSRRLTNPGESTARIEARGGIDFVCDQVRQGETIANIAKLCGVTWVALWHYCNRDPQSTMLLRDAQAASGERYTEKALEELESIPNQAPAAQVARHRELASHFRWMASKRDPRRYGDKLDITATVTEKPDPALLDARLGAILGQVIRPELAAPQTVDEDDPLLSLDVEDVEYTEITHASTQALDKTGETGA